MEAITERLTQVGVRELPPSDVISLNSLNSLTSPNVSSTTGPVVAPTSSRRRGPEWPEPLGEEAYYGLGGEITKAIEPHTEASTEAVLLQLLVGFGNAIGRAAHFVVEADRHYSNLFLVIVGETSKGRKGTSYGQAKNLLKSADNEWATTRQATGISSGEGLIWAVRDPIEKTEPVKEKGKPTGEYQTVVVDQGVEDKRLLVVEPEFASVLKVIARDTNTASAIIRQCWDDGNLRSLTKNSPARASDAHISIIGHVTKDELRRNLEDTETANGFANRFLWACAKRSKVLPEGGNLAAVDFGPIVRRLSEALEFGKTTGLVKKSKAAVDLWADVYAELSEGAPGLFGAVTGRAESQVMRLALIYALLDCSKTIKVPHLQAALAVWKYCEDSARYVFGDAVGDPIADTILAALEEAGEDGLSRTDIHNLLKRHASANRLNTALSALASSGRIRSRKEQTEGRPVEKWVFQEGSAKEAKKAKKVYFEPLTDEKPRDDLRNKGIEADAEVPGGTLNSLNSLNSLSTPDTNHKNGTAPKVSENGGKLSEKRRLEMEYEDGVCPPAGEQKTKLTIDTRPLLQQSLEPIGSDGKPMAF